MLEMNALYRNGSDGRVYGGDVGLVHIEDGKRKNLGNDVANYLDAEMRLRAKRLGNVVNKSMPICPGCGMIALFNASIIMAKENGMPVTELANTMKLAYEKLAASPGDGLTEEIEIVLDPAC